MTSKTLLSILTILAILPSCQNKNNPAITENVIGNHTMQVIHYDMIQDSSDIQLSDLAKNFHFVQMETKPECLFDRAQYYVYEKYILVIERDKRILQFAQDGKFIRQICNYGQGPREFQNPVFTINEEQDMLYLGSNNKSYIMTWNLNTGEFMKEIPLPYNGKIKRILLTADGNILVAPIVGSGEAGGFYVWEQTPEGEIVRDIRAPSVQGWVDSDQDVLLYYNGNGFNYLPIKKDTIFTVEESELAPSWFIDFGSKNENLVNQVGHHSFNYEFETENLFMGTVYTLEKVEMIKYEGGVGYTTNGTQRILLINKNSYSIARSEKIRNDLTNQTASIYSLQFQENQMMTLPVNAIDLIEQYEILQTDPDSDPKINKRLSEMTKGLTAEDNPVLIIGRIK